GSDRPAAAARWPEPRLDPLGRCGARVPRPLLRRAVVLHRILAHATRAQLLLRRGSVGLLEPARPVALRVLADRFGPGDRTGTRDRCGARDRGCAPRPVVGHLDPGPARRNGRLPPLSALGPSPSSPLPPFATPTRTSRAPRDPTPSASSY